MDFLKNVTDNNVCFVQHCVGIHKYLPNEQEFVFGDFFYPFQISNKRHVRV